MIVSIRMARHGRIHRPFYKIVVIDRRKPARGKPIEQIGIFDPYAKEKKAVIKWNRLEYWLHRGACLSRRLISLKKKFDAS